MAAINELRKTYIMKDVGKPQYYLGGDVIDLGTEWEKEGITSAFSAETYIINALPKLAELCDLEYLKKPTHLSIRIIMLNLMNPTLCHLRRYHCINHYEAVPIGSSH